MWKYSVCVSLHGYILPCGIEFDYAIKQWKQNVQPAIPNHDKFTTLTYRGLSMRTNVLWNKKEVGDPINDLERLSLKNEKQNSFTHMCFKFFNVVLTFRKQKH